MPAGKGCGADLLRAYVTMFFLRDRVCRCHIRLGLTIPLPPFNHWFVFVLNFKSDLTTPVVLGFRFHRQDSSFGTPPNWRLTLFWILSCVLLVRVSEQHRCLPPSTKESNRLVELVPMQLYKQSTVTGQRSDFASHTDEHWMALPPWLLAFQPVSESWFTAAAPPFLRINYQHGLNLL